MQQVKAGRRPGAALVLAAFLPSAALPDQVEYNGYYFGDIRDNTVATTAFSLVKTVFRRTVVMLDLELDQTTIPALESDGFTGASRPRHKVSGSSEFRKNRGQLIGGLEQGLGDNTRIGANYYFSHEIDYRSQAVVGSITQELFQKNLTLTVKAQYTVDSVGEILPQGALLNRFKETHQVSASASQLLSPTTVLRAGADGFRAHGFLSDPYRFVLKRRPGSVLLDTVRESHPSLRFRYAGWAEISQYLSGLEASLVGTYRYYQDDWNLNAHTAELKLNKYILEDWVLTPDYRYHIQNAADFGAYQGDFHTGDYKLKAFESHTMGLGLTCFLRAFAGRREALKFLAHTSLTLKYFHYFNNEASTPDSDPEIVDSPGEDFAADVTEMRLKFEF